MKILRTAALLLLSLCVLPVSVLGESGEDYTVSYEGITTGIVNARTAVHDPSIIAVDGRYYIFGSHMAAAYSDNLRGWNRMANGYQPDNPVWGNLFAEGSHVFDWAGSRSSVIPTDDGANHVWAPDVIWNPVMQKYMMYYCVSSTWNASALCFGLSDTIVPIVKIAAASVGMAAVLAALKAHLSTLPVVAALAILVAAGSAAYALFALVFLRGEIQTLRISLSRRRKR